MRKIFAFRALSAFLIKTAGAALAFLQSVVLARELGTAGYGVYSYVFAIVSTVAVPVQLGLPNLIVRETASALEDKNWRLMRGLWIWSSGFVGIISLIVAIAVLLFAFFMRQSIAQETIRTLYWGVLLIPLVALSNIRGSAMRGLHFVIFGQFPELVLRRGFLIVFVLGTIYIEDAQILPDDVMRLHAVSATLSFAIGMIMLRRITPREMIQSEGKEYRSELWVKSAFSLALVSAVDLINQNADILILGSLQDARSVGVYKAVTTGSNLVTFGLQAITLLVAPKFSQLWQRRDKVELQNVVTNSSRFIVLAALPAAFVIFISGEELLKVFFGAEFSSGGIALSILAAAQLINASMGSNSMLLIMTGLEGKAIQGLAISAVLNIALNFALVPHFGLDGAAASTSISVVVWNIIIRGMAKRHLGIETLAFDLKQFGKITK